MQAVFTTVRRASYPLALIALGFLLVGCPPDLGRVWQLQV